jgi:hypothetical protein
MSDDITPINTTFNVIVHPATAQENWISILSNADKCLELIDRHAGNVRAFVSMFSPDPVKQQQALYFAEQCVRESSGEAWAKWRAAIKRGQMCRVRMLQEEALTRLEANKSKAEDRYAADTKGEEAALKRELTDDLAFAKLVLPDIFAGMVADAKARKPKPGGALQQNDDDTEVDAEDVAEYEEAMADV